MFYKERRREILLMVVTALFVMAFTGSAFSDTPVGTAGSYMGKVIAIDNAKKIVTVRSAAGDEKTFTRTDYGQVFRCGKAGTWAAIKVGDEVTISYFEKTPGNYVADSLTLSSGMDKCS